MTQITIKYRKPRQRPDRATSAELVEWFLRCSRRVQPADAKAWQEVTLFFMGERGMRGANRLVFGKSESTDVISLRYDPLPGFDSSGSGEVLVNVDLALVEGCRRRARANWSAAHELALYVAHGVDHLTGASDATPAGRRRMRARELNWVRSAERRGLLAGLLRGGTGAEEGDE